MVGTLKLKENSVNMEDNIFNLIEFIITLCDKFMNFRSGTVPLVGKFL